MKKLNKTLLITGGIFNLIFAFFHLMFYWMFDWGNELAKLSPINSNIMQMLNYCLVAFFMMMGVIILMMYNDILETGLGKSILALMSIVLSVRLVLEFVLPSSSIVLGVILLVNILFYTIPLIMSKETFTTSKEIKF